MGFYRLDLQVGYQAVGVSVVNPSLFGSWIESSGTTTITATDTTVDVGALLDAEKSYYVEIVEGTGGTGDPLVGQRFELHVDDTIAPATGGGVLALDMGAASTTWVPATAPDLSGYRFELRAHMTLGQVFDTDVLYGSTNFAEADQVQVFDGSGFAIYYVLDVGGFKQWTRQADPNYDPQGNLAIAPGQGLIFKRSALSADTATVRVQGVARETPFVQPMAAGFNFVSEPFPVTNSFDGRDAFPGAFGNGDRVQLFDGAGFDTYELYAVASLWVDTLDPGYESQNMEPLFDYRSAVFVNLSNPTTSYRIDPPYAPEPAP